MRWWRGKAFHSARRIAASAKNIESSAASRFSGYAHEVRMAIWFGNPTIEGARASSAGLLAEHLGIEFVELGDDFLRGTMPVEPRTHQPMGYLHGGASVAFAETLGSIAANFAVDRAKFRCLGQEINANHLRPVTEGLVSGVARPFHLGSRSQVWNIEIRDPKERLVCISRLTVAVVQWRGATPNLEAHT
jgi:1,4-dihydroxy-2-naphthoyl-CoA hydrolase